MKDNIRIAKELVRIAKSIVSSEEDGMINSREEFKESAENGALSEILVSVGPEIDGQDVYAVDTNGNDSFYQMFIYVGDNGIYYNDASLTEDDIERDGEDASAHADDGYQYDLEDFPVEEKDIIRFCEKKVENGVNEGSKVWNDRPVEGQDVSYEDVPEWALPYIINGDSSGLTTNEKDLVDSWMMDVMSVDTTDENPDDFNRYPAFGLPTSTQRCRVVFKK